MNHSVNIIIKISLIILILFNIVIFLGRLNTEYSMLYNVLDTIGYILGLLGIYQYIYNRNKSSLIMVGSSVSVLTVILIFIDRNMVFSKFFWIIIVAFIYFLIMTVRRRRRNLTE